MVQSLAVDVEPVVFWNGEDPDPSALLERWKRAVHFVDGEHGTVKARGNGPSGCKVQHRYLEPLRVTPDEAAYTDIYPVYMVKRGTVRQPQQWDAIEREYNPIADALGCEKACLPPRLSPARLVRAAVEEYGRQLTQDLEAVSPDVVVTLGDEAMQAILRVESIRTQVTDDATTLAALRAAGRYGTGERLWVDGRCVRWLPLVHPGQLQACETPPIPLPLPPVPHPSWRWDLVHAWWQTKVRSS